MNERVRPTKTGLFMTELLICVGVFSLCAAVCVGLFVKSEVISQDSADLTRAVAEARNAAECFKAAGGDLERTAALAGGEAAAEDALFLEFDKSWEKLAPGTRGAFELAILTVPGDGGTNASLSVKRWTENENGAAGENILLWTISALEVRP